MKEKQEKKVDKENKKSIQKVTANNKQNTDEKMFAGGGYDISNNSINCNNANNSSPSEWKG